MDKEDLPYNASDINMIVCAEISGAETQLLLFDTVTKCTLHGPCDSRCLKDGTCTKGHPKYFARIYAF
jgi:hypothetical protein